MYLSLPMACELHWKGRDFSPPSGVVANLTSEPFICKTLERSWSVIEAAVFEELGVTMCGVHLRFDD